MTAPTHQGLYRNAPLVLGGLLGAFALLIIGVATALEIAATGDELLPLVLGVLAAFVLVFAGCMLAALRRHRWTIESDAVLIEEALPEVMRWDRSQRRSCRLRMECDAPHKEEGPPWVRRPFWYGAVWGGCPVLWVTGRCDGRRRFASDQLVTRRTGAAARGDIFRQPRFCCIRERKVPRRASG